MRRSAKYVSSAAARSRSRWSPVDRCSGPRGGAQGVTSAEKRRRRRRLRRGRGEVDASCQVRNGEITARSPRRRIARDVGTRYSLQHATFSHNYLFFDQALAGSRTSSATRDANSTAPVIRTSPAWAEGSNRLGGELARALAAVRSGKIAIGRRKKVPIEEALRSGSSFHVNRARSWNDRPSPEGCGAGHDRHRVNPEWSRRPTRTFRRAEKTKSGSDREG